MQIWAVFTLTGWGSRWEESSRSSTAAKAELLPPILISYKRLIMSIPVLYISRSPTNDNEMFQLLGEAGGIYNGWFL